MAERLAARELEPADVKSAERLVEAYRELTRAIGTVIVGQEDAIDQIMLALFCQGHCILEGVPGLAKTLMVSSLAKLLALEFRRIQFTPDLMPADITGTEILEEDVGTGRRQLKFVKGPIFGNLLLADELNRTPPKTQSALLQAMQEYKVTAAGQDYPLQPPFLVLGTQNPIEQEGTYHLPEAQLDRFMFKIFVNYPNFEDEVNMAVATTGQQRVDLKPVLSRELILNLQQVVRKVIVGDSVAQFAVRLVRASRPNTDEAPDFIKKYVAWGAGPRACQALLLGSKAKALLAGRYNASIDDIRYIAKPVLRHRIVSSFTAEAEGITNDKLIDRLLEETLTRVAAGAKPAKAAR